MNISVHKTKQEIKGKESHSLLMGQQNSTNFLAAIQKYAKRIFKIFIFFGH